MNYAALKTALQAELESGRVERRAHVRLNMRVQIKLRGRDATGKDFEISTMTENVSPAGFLANCSVNLKQGDPLEVFVTGASDRFAGRAKPVRMEARGAPWQRYGFQFLEVTSDWIIRAT